MRWFTCKMYMYMYFEKFFIFTRKLYCDMTGWCCKTGLEETSALPMDFHPDPYAYKLIMNYSMITEIMTWPISVNTRNSKILLDNGPYTYAKS